MNIEIKSREKNGYEQENKLLIEKIKELEAENCMYFKRVSDLTQQQVDKMNEINLLYEQIKTQHIVSVTQNKGETDTVKQKPFDISSSIREEFFSRPPSKVKFTIQAHKKGGWAVKYDH